jgi:hypothetical protein
MSNSYNRTEKFVSAKTDIETKTIKAGSVLHSCLY